MRKRLICLATIGAMAAMAAGAAPPAAAAGVARPGASITADGSYCTLNWIYDGAEGPYAGTAAHCVSEVGQEVSLSETSLGSAIGPLGTVAYISPSLDFALIHIDPAVAIEPSLKGHPHIPSGVATVEETGLGDVCQFSGHGVGFHLTQPTQEERFGPLIYNDGEQHYCNGPVTPGDSGGPVGLQGSNKALGIVTTVGVGIAGGLPQAGEGGVSLEGALADAAEHGFAVTLRTV